MPQRHSHHPLARDANLRKVQRATAWTFVGGVALTGGFYAAGVEAFSGAGHTATAATVVTNVDDTTGVQDSIADPALPDPTPPSVVTPQQNTASTPAASPVVPEQAPTTIPEPTAAATIPIAPPTQPVTLPHKKKHHSQPPPVVSGGS
jgi:hypothetical protein